LRADSSAIKQAKSHRTIPFSMMAGRTYKGKAIINVLGHDRFEQRKETTGGQECSAVRLRRDWRIGIKSEAVLLRGSRHAVYVAGVVHQGNLCGRCEARVKTFEPGTVILRKRVQECGNPIRTLWMMTTSVVLLVACINDNSCTQHTGSFAFISNCHVLIPVS
jgi:hypothetical protein